MQQRAGSMEAAKDQEEQPRSWAQVVGRGVPAERAADDEAASTQAGSSECGDEVRGDSPADLSPMLSEATDSDSDAWAAPSPEAVQAPRAAPPRTGLRLRSQAALFVPTAAGGGGQAAVRPPPGLEDQGPQAGAAADDDLFGRRGGWPAAAEAAPSGPRSLPTRQLLRRPGAGAAAGPQDAAPHAGTRPARGRRPVARPAREAGHRAGPPRQRRLGRGRAAALALGPHRLGVRAAPDRLLAPSQISGVFLPGGRLFPQWLPPPLSAPQCCRAAGPPPRDERAHFRRISAPRAREAPHEASGARGSAPPAGMRR
ncbi:unnamed protein product [Prorocentrum cordatum]|uniref:Uncharacterized protein n=1 Tax=Prorocentrum cordatum TaxID=2364126 RepID=A0ABN9RCD5_9DINO|nr:unnamed protein product [Polarella glacialis]